MTDDDKIKSDTPSSVRVKKLKRGASVEADKLLDYLVRPPAPPRPLSPEHS